MNDATLSVSAAHPSEALSFSVDGQQPSTFPLWQPPSPEELQRQLPAYRIFEMVGRGGMAAVYRGWQVSLERMVAIKILPPNLEDDGIRFAERFQREARMMAKFQHPGIVSIFDTGETASGILYIVMEYVEGTDVARMVKSQGRLPAHQALAITAHMCEALQYAHSHGVMHRDIKPANIMADLHGQVKVADFGLAKPSEAAGHGLTRSGVTMGTPYYMAPEALIPGSVADHRADLYAVGVMLQNMLTGEIPRGQFLLPSETVGTDPRIDDIIVRAMQPEREQRYQSAQEILRDLDPILGTPTSAAVSVPKQAVLPAPKSATSRSTPWRTLAVFAGLAALVIGALLLRPGTRVNTAVVTAAVLGDSASATLEQPFVNTLGMKFVPVPDTKVLFCIHDTRKGDYRAYAKANSGVDSSWENVEFLGVPVSEGEEHPVVEVSWEDATEFCKWLSKKEGRTYRLPTDHEWSVAVGIGDQEKESATPKDKDMKIDGVYPWGTQWPPPKGSGNFADLSFKEKFTNSTFGFIDGYRDRFPTTSPVLSFTANKLGLYDMAGNVWQWCGDWYDTDQKSRVLRGGSWFYGQVPHGLLSSGRHVVGTAGRGCVIGFRVVVENGVPPSPNKEHAVVKPPIVDARMGEAAPLMATKEQPFINSVGMKFVPVPGTKALFCIHDTRKGDYRAYANASSGVDASWKKVEFQGVPVSDGEDHPVVNVNWEDANGFCAWLSAKERRTYRLPTDHEWSVAVGIGDQEDATASPKSKDGKIDVFPWGRQWPPPKGAGNFADSVCKKKLPTHTVIDGYDDGFATTSPVVSFRPNELGLYDMGGNVWQWCEDWYDSDQKYRVLRGGSCFNGRRVDLLSSRRGRSDPSDRRGVGLGFRVVVEAGSAKAGNPVPQSPRKEQAVAIPPDVDANTGGNARPGATKEQPFINSLGMKFVPVLGTKALFCIHDTRKGDYRAYANASSGVDASWKKVEFRGVPVSDGDEHPVVNVGWEDAKGFCAWLSAKERRTYRLPTDHEWSVAVGIGDQEDAAAISQRKSGTVADVYPWGPQWPPPKGAGNFADSAFVRRFPDMAKIAIEGYDDGFATTSPVMSFEPNKLGLYDMAGNVWQWCENWDDSEQTYRVLRGGSWGSSYNDVRFSLLSSSRNAVAPSSRSYYLGFRVVLGAGNGGAETPVPQSTRKERERAEVTAKMDALHAYFKTRSLGSELLQFHCGDMANQFGNTEFAELAPIADQIGLVDLVGSKVTDAGCATLAKMLNVDRLFLTNTTVSDAGVAQLAGLSHLDHLNLYGTRVTDAGIVQLTGNKALKELFVGQTAVTKAAARKLEAANPGLVVRLDFSETEIGKLVEEAKPSTPEARTGGTALPSATMEQPFINSLGMKFVPVPGTKVLFCIHDTRNGDYRKYADATPGVNALWRNPFFPPVRPGEDHPVVQLNWEEAKAFCAWLSRKEERTYRLPTDHEWSVAVGIGDREDSNASPGSKNGEIPGVFPWGAKWPPPAGAGNFADITYKNKIHWENGGGTCIEGYDDGFPRTSPVMSFAPNKFGLYDMAGNVWQYCDEKPYLNKAANRWVRLSRGSAWLSYNKDELLSSSRREIVSSIGEVGLRGTASGFRCVLAAGDGAVENTALQNAQKEQALANPPIVDAKTGGAGPPGATKEQPFINSLGMKFVPVPGTKVLFCIHDTRKGDYRAYTNASSGVDESWKAVEFHGVHQSEGEDHPVVMVSWDDANAFCAWLTKKEGRTYRLPTDNEWSWAVGIGDREKPNAVPEAKNAYHFTSEYPWGAAWPPPAGVANLADSEYKKKFPNATTSPVMSFQPNNLGLYDMSGNVRQWCEDIFNPRRSFRVQRGSSWRTGDSFHLVSHRRGGFNPDARCDYVGFRCVLEQ